MKQSPYRVEDDLLGKVGFPLVIAVVSLGLLVWLSGEVSALAATGSWPGTSLTHMARLTLRLATTPSEPAEAWPQPARLGLIPGPVFFYAVMTVLFLVGCTGALLVKRWFGPLSAETADGRSNSWARAADLRPLRVSKGVPGRLTLGRIGSKVIAAEERQSVIVLGPTQSMKTTGLAIPAILEWDGPVLATSVKNDLLQHTLGERRRRGDVWVFDPSGSSGEASSRWNPLEMCGDWRGAQRTAMWLSSAGRSGSGGLSDSEFWYAAATKLLAPHLFAAHVSARSMADVVRWINTQEEREVDDALRSAGVDEALHAAQASWKREARQKSSVYTTLETVLAAYEDPVVAASARGCDIKPESLLDGGQGTLYVVSPSHEQKRLRPLFETLLQTVINHAYEASNRRRAPLDPPLLVVLDEAANIAPLRDLDSLASTAAGHGIQLVSVFQDLSQVSARYAERALTVVNNHRAKIICSGVSDTQTLEYASRLLGDEEVLHASVTRGGSGARSTTESTTLRSLAPAQVLRGVRPGEAILVYGHLPPARLYLRPWFSDRDLRMRAER